MQRRGYDTRNRAGGINIRRRGMLANAFSQRGRSARELYGDDAKMFMAAFENSEFLQGLATPFMPVIKGVKGLVDVAKLVKPALGMLKTFLKQAIMFFAGAILAVTLIGALYYYLKQRGTIDKITKFVVDTWPTVREYLEIVYDRVVKAVKNIIILAGYYYDLITGLFSGNEEKVREAIGNILNWIQKAWINFRDFIIPLLIDSFYKVSEIISDAINNAYEKIIDDIIPNFDGYMTKLSNLIPKAAQGDTTSDDDPAGAAKRKFGGVGLTGGGFGGGGFIGMATGGTVTSSGMFIVGEEGPEAVALPAGARVLNNQQTRSMGNTINVHVNGRVGASEQELNELARRIGEKINREMNRFGGLGIRA